MDFKIIHVHAVSLGLSRAHIHSLESDLATVCCWISRFTMTCYTTCIGFHSMTNSVSQWHACVTRCRHFLCPGATPLKPTAALPRQEVECGTVVYLSTPAASAAAVNTAMAGERKLLANNERRIQHTAPHMRRCASAVRVQYRKSLTV